MRPLFAAGLALALAAPAGAQPVEILWDDWGVPHVYAEDDAGAFYGLGHATAEAHAELVLRLYGEARGRAAEYWGEAHLESDRRIRTLGIPDRAARWVTELDAREREFLDAFVAGLNDGAAAVDGLADSLAVVLPITSRDVLAHAQRVIHFTFVPAPWDAAGRVTPGLGGSNAWAIGPTKSASGHAMLLANPHLPWHGLWRWFEAHLVAPGVDVYGATLVGFPFLGVGFNDRLGWTHTVNPVDAADLYALEIVDGGYRWDGGVRPFEVERDTLLVRGADGSVADEPLVIRRSVQGPVVAEDEERAYALRVAGLDRPHLIGQYRDMARARTLAEFEAALSRLQMPFFNVVYADADGHVMYVFNGAVPRRERGDWSFWTGVVPGDDPALVWDEIHAYEELPRVLDPPAGWIQNANDPPWTSTWPAALDPDDYPPYLSTFGVSFRPQRSIALLRDDEAISFDELVRYKHDTRIAMADRFLDDLLPLASAHGGEAARAAAVLEGWSRTADADARGGPLFAEFVGQWNARARVSGERFARPWSPTAPLETPDGFADPVAAVDALVEAAANVEAAHGALDAAWGEVFRLRGDTLDLPANGAPDPLGVFRVTGYTGGPGPTAVASFGDSWVAAIEFGDPVRARGLLSYGNASRPGSAHRWDQLPLYAEKRLRPIRLRRADVEAHLERRDTLRP